MFPVWLKSDPEEGCFNVFDEQILKYWPGIKNLGGMKEAIQKKYATQFETITKLRHEAICTLENCPRESSCWKDALSVQVCRIILKELT